MVAIVSEGVAAGLSASLRGLTSAVERYVHSMSEFVTGLYENRAAAEAAVEKLERLGYERRAVSVIMDDRARAKAFAAETGTTLGSAHRVVDAAKAAAAVGGALAAIVGGAVAMRARRAAAADRPSPSSQILYETDSSLGEVEETVAYEVTIDAPGGEARPDSKLSIIGPVAAVIVPAVGAGLVAAFSKAGVPKEHAESYASGLSSGGVVVGLYPKAGDEGLVRQALSPSPT